jgi:hypothetical protein
MLHGRFRAATSPRPGRVTWPQVAQVEKSFATAERAARLLVNIKEFNLAEKEQASRPGQTLHRAARNKER